MQIDNNHKCMLYIALTFLSLSILSMWIKKSPLIWGLLGSLSLICAQRSGQLTANAFIPLIIGFTLFWILQWNIKGLARLVIIGVALILVGSIFSCLLPGFPCCFTLFNAKINYGKMAITLPILGWLLPTLATPSGWVHFFKSYLALSIVGSFILLGLAYYLHPPSLPSFFLQTPSSMVPWTLCYLFATVIPEEVLLRGFLQKELFPFLGKGLLSHIATIFISSTIFSLFHLGWVTDLSLLTLTFLTGCVYGFLYQTTKTIEASIICRALTSYLYFFILSKEGFL